MVDIASGDPFDDEEIIFQAPQERSRDTYTTLGDVFKPQCNTIRQSPILLYGPTVGLLDTGGKGWLLFGSAILAFQAYRVCLTNSPLVCASASEPLPSACQYLVRAHITNHYSEWWW